MAADGLLLTARRARPARRSPSGASWASTSSACRCSGRASRRTSRAYEPPAGLDPANPDGGYNWGRARPGGPAAAARRASGRCCCSAAPPPLWASTRPRVGNPRYKPSAWHFGQFASRRRQPLRRARRGVHPLERAEPAALAPAAGASARASAARRSRRTSTATWSASAYPAIKAVDPQSKVLIGALAPTGGRLQSKNANIKPLQWLRAFGCVNDKLQPVVTGPVPDVRARDRRRLRLPPAQHQAPADEPYPNKDDASIACAQARREGARPPAEHRAPGRHDQAARPLARRVRLPDQPARQAPRRHARAGRTATCRRRRTSPGATRACR